MVDSIYDDSGDLTTMGEYLEQLDTAFTAVFTAELLFNALCRTIPAFLSDGWNLFDICTIALSLFALAVSSNKLPINVIRSVRALRAFRMLRLLGKLKSLKNIVAALSASVIPVLHAFLIVLISDPLALRPSARSGPPHRKLCSTSLFSAGRLSLRL
jgi:hypothetical protein